MSPGKELSACQATESGRSSTPDNPSDGYVWRQHQDRLADKGVSEPFYAMVHQQIPIKKALDNEEARAAIDKEWKKLEAKNFVDYFQVMEKWKCKQEAVDKGITRHFGRVEELCHLKNA